MPEQDQTLRPATTNLLLVAGEFMLLVALGLIPVMAVYADVVVLGNEVGEASVTEITQSVLLLATIAIFARGAWRLPHHRGLLILGAGFFGCAFVRESDSLLDVVWHGFWVWPVTLIALATVTYVAVNARDGLIGSIAHLARTRAYPFILMGLIVVLVFSRTFGSGNLLWEEVLAAHYTIQFKSALQEGLELFGYLLILHGSIALLVDASPPETAASRHESQPTDAG